MQHFSTGHNVQHEHISARQLAIIAGHCPMSGVYFLAWFRLIEYDIHEIAPHLSSWTDLYFLICLDIHLLRGDGAGVVVGGRCSSGSKLTNFLIDQFDMGSTWRNFRRKISVTYLKAVGWYFNDMMIWWYWVNQETPSLLLSTWSWDVVIPCDTLSLGS